MKSFLQGKKTLDDNPPLRAPSAPAGALSRVTGIKPGAESHSTNVEVIKEGDKVVRLVITCACGERTEVDCIYSCS